MLHDELWPASSSWEDTEFKGAVFVEQGPCEKDTILILPRNSIVWIAWWASIIHSWKFQLFLLHRFVFFNRTCSDYRFEYCSTFLDWRSGYAGPIFEAQCWKCHKSDDYAFDFSAALSCLPWSFRGMYRPLWDYSFANASLSMHIRSLWQTAKF